MNYPKRKLRYKGVPVGKFGLPEIITKPKYEPKKDRVRNYYLRSFASNLSQKTKGKLLVMYDIPETKKRYRDWLRRQLLEFGFEIVQRSVWVGPAPLPKEFVNYLSEIGLKKDFQIFNLAKKLK